MIKNCSICGEIIYFRGLCKDYRYKKLRSKERKLEYFCSYTCMAKAEQERGQSYVKMRDK